MKEPTALEAHGRFSVQGRSVLVTGAAHGLGLAIASAFAGAEARVIMTDIDADALSSAHKVLSDVGNVVACPADVRDDRQVAEVVRFAASASNGLDVVVNDAAISQTSTIETMSSELLLDVLDVNVAGYARVVRAAHPCLIASGRGRVINLASIMFQLGFPPRLSAYVASKGGVLGLTRALARELGPHNVTVNAISPGAFPTRAEERVIEDRVAYERLILDSQCLKRRGEVSDIACAALFLASDAASFITGQTLVVDGGWIFV